MEEALGIKYKKIIDKQGRTLFHNISKYSLIRYADDFVVLCKTREDAEDVYKLLDEYLKERGLKLAGDDFNYPY